MFLLFEVMFNFLNFYTKETFIYPILSFIYHSIIKLLQKHKISHMKLTSSEEKESFIKYAPLVEIAQVSF